MGAGRAFLIASVLVAAPAVRAEDKRPPPPSPSLAPLPPAVIDNTLEIGGEDIGGRKSATRMTVPVEVNGRGPFRFIVDSGADTSVIGTRLARVLALPPGPDARLFGMTAIGPVGRVLVDDLRLGRSSSAELQLPVLDEGSLGGAGMIGIDALVEQRLMLDFEKRVIKVEDATRPARRLDGEIVVTARRRRGQLILTEARANGTPVEAVIDTGSEITIGNSALRDKLTRRSARNVETLEVTGVTGVTATLQLVRVSELRLGPVVLRNVPVAFADVPPFAAFGLNDGPALLLGTDLMETFRRVSLDFRRRKVRFQLRRCGSTGVTISTAMTGGASRIAAAKETPGAC